MRGVPQRRSIVSKDVLVSGDEPEFDGFEWDPVKSAATNAARGFGFDAAVLIFAGPIFEREDLRQGYGERRFLATGEMDGEIVTVVWTPRRRNRRIISVWPASNRERREYRDYRAANDG